MMSLKPYISLQAYDDDLYGENNDQRVKSLYIGISVLVPDGYVIRLKKPFLTNIADRAETKCCLICLELFQARAQRYYGPQSYLLSISTKTANQIASERIAINSDKLFPEDLELVEVRVVYNHVENSDNSISGFFNDNVTDGSLMNMKIVGRSSMRVSDAGLLIQEPGFGVEKVEINADLVETRSIDLSAAKEEVLSTELFPIEKLLDLKLKNIGRVVGPDTKPKKPSGPPGT